MNDVASTTEPVISENAEAKNAKSFIGKLLKRYGEYFRATMVLK